MRTPTYPKQIPLPPKWKHNFDRGIFRLLSKDAPEGYAFFIHEQESPSNIFTEENQTFLYTWGEMIPLSL